MLGQLVCSSAPVVLEGRERVGVEGLGAACGHGYGFEEKRAYECGDRQEYLGVGVGIPLLPGGTVAVGDGRAGGVCEVAVCRVGAMGFGGQRACAIDRVCAGDVVGRGRVDVARRGELPVLSRKGGSRRVVAALEGAVGTEGMESVGERGQDGAVPQRMDGAEFEEPGGHLVPDRRRDEAGNVLAVFCGGG